MSVGRYGTLLTSKPYLVTEAEDIVRACGFGKCA